jgi:hypothetical protein
MAFSCLITAHLFFRQGAREDRRPHQPAPVVPNGAGHQAAHHLPRRAHQQRQDLPGAAGVCCPWSHGESCLQSSISSDSVASAPSCWVTRRFSCWSDKATTFCQLERHAHLQCPPHAPHGEWWGAGDAGRGGGAVLCAAAAAGHGGRRHLQRGRHLLQPHHRCWSRAITQLSASLPRQHTGVVQLRVSHKAVSGCAAGQERQEVPGAGHLACTIEMADLRRQVDVAVIDEIQVGVRCNRVRRRGLSPVVSGSV